MLFCKTNLIYIWCKSLTLFQFLPDVHILFIFFHFPYQIELCIFHYSFFSPESPPQSIKHDRDYFSFRLRSTRPKPLVQFKFKTNRWACMCVSELVERDGGKMKIFIVGWHFPRMMLVNKPDSIIRVGAQYCVDFSLWFSLCAVCSPNCEVYFIAVC